jgi:hypothetical protein
MGEDEGGGEAAHLLRDVIRHFLADFLRLVDEEAARELNLANLYFPPECPVGTPEETGELSLAAQALVAPGGQGHDPRPDPAATAAAFAEGVERACSHDRGALSGTTVTKDPARPRFSPLRPASSTPVKAPFVAGSSVSSGAFSQRVAPQLLYLRAP